MVGLRIWNSLPTDLRECGLVMQPFYTVTEEVQIWAVGSQHSVNLFRNAFTYLLTYMHIQW